MFFQLRIFFQSLVFMILLEISSLPQVGEFLYEIFSKSATLLVLSILLIGAYAFRTAHKISRRLVMTPIPIIFFLSSFGLLYFISSPAQEHVFIVLCAGVYYFFHLGSYRLRIYPKDKTALGLVGAAVMATIFIFLSTAYGIYLNFVFPLWALLLALLATTTLISFQFFWILKGEKRLVWSYSLVLGLIMTEIAWIASFWPFGYLTTGVITLIFYYVFWDLVYRNFIGVLTKKRVVANIIFLGILTTIVLLSSKWLPVI